jgi:putative ABC transport system substrate-binding protein
VRIIHGFAPGGGADIIARLIGQWLSERLGQPFVVESWPGDATNTATEAVVPNGGLIMPTGPWIGNKTALIVGLAARHRLPAVYPARERVVDGGLISYAPDLLDMFRRSASYVDRILKGAKPADLPIQLPTKYELVVNLKTAKAIGLTIPETFLVRADEVIE